MSQYEEILVDLENSYNDGKIDYESYQDLKMRYIKKKEESNTQQRKSHTTMKFKAMGSHSVSDDAIKFAGAARLPGGVVPKKVSVSGTCKIGSDLECNGLKCSGVLRSFGSIFSHEDFRVSGAMRCEGAVTAEKNVHVSGSARIFGEVIVTGLITVSGSMRGKRNVSGKGGVKISGRGKIDGSLLSEAEVAVKGYAKIGGNLIAENVKIKAPNQSISFFRRLLGRHGRSRVEGSVVGNEVVDIENIEVVGDVNGRIVKIGPNSNIEGTVKYVEDLILADDVSLRNKPIQVSAQSLNLPTQSSNKFTSNSIKTKTPAEKSERTMFCPKCGQEVGVGRKFCAACGSELH